MGGRGASSSSNSAGGKTNGPNKGVPQWRLKKAYDSLEEKGLHMTKEDTIRLAKEFHEALGGEKATKDNFFENSVGEWELRSRKPNGEPDYVSFTHDRRGYLKRSSEYWYTEKGVYRRSNHWGSEVASCSWYLKGREYASYGVRVGQTRVAFIKWEDLLPKVSILKAGAHPTDVQIRYGIKPNSYYFGAHSGEFKKL